jgi:hypothetical protein
MYFRKQYRWSVLVFIAAFGSTVHAQDISGTWAIQDLQIANRLQLSLRVTRPGNGTSFNSSAFDVGQLRGLSPQQMASPTGGIARFELVREAGTFVCEGYFRSGNGAGTFMFQPSAGVITKFRALGFEDVTEDQLFSLAIHDVGPRFASEIRATGVMVTSISKLIAMKIHGVTPEFIRGMQQAGYMPDEKDVVRLRIHGVSADFAYEIHRMFALSSLKDLVRLRIHGVTLDDIRMMQTRSRNISLDQIVRLKIHGID